MDILFKTKKLCKDLCDFKRAVRTHGDRRARLIRRRLDQFRAANHLFDMAALPQTRCHALKGNRADQFSVDLDHPYRLIFRPANEAIVKLPSGGPDWKHITCIEILGIEDTHG